MEKLHTFQYTLNSPIGYLKIVSDSKHLLSLTFIEKPEPNSKNIPEILENSKIQLEEYFHGKRKNFDLLLCPNGSNFQKVVWKKICEISFGETSTYLKLAIQTGSAKNTRAVGSANGKNQIPIIIPCHRVIGTNGKLTGYAGGLERKRWLLKHELEYSSLIRRLF
jgi:methylated-DNA-[protein]-cysteine S-methyltransferase